eukprot:6100756-Amphidinium_carterae.1
MLLASNRELRTFSICVPSGGRAHDETNVDGDTQTSSNAVAAMSATDTMTGGDDDSNDVNVRMGEFLQQSFSGRGLGSSKRWRKCSTYLAPVIPPYQRASY